MGVADRRPLREPRAAGAARRRQRAWSSSPRTVARTGATAWRDRRGRRPAGAGRARRPFRAPRASEPARARGPHRAPQRSRQRPAHRAAGIRDVRPPAGPHPLRDHRLRRDPGGGSLAGEAGARRPRGAPSAPRESRRERCAWSAPTPSGSSHEGSRAARRPRSPTPRWQRRPNPYGDGQAADADRRAPSSTCCSAASLRPRSAPATAGRCDRAGWAGFAAAAADAAAEPHPASRISTRRRGDAGSLPSDVASPFDGTARRGGGGCFWVTLVVVWRSSRFRLDVCSSSSADGTRDARAAVRRRRRRRGALHVGLPGPGAERGGDDRRQRRAPARRTRVAGDASSSSTTAPTTAPPGSSPGSPTPTVTSCAASRRTHSRARRRRSTTPSARLGEPLRHVDRSG